MDNEIRNFLDYVAGLAKQADDSKHIVDNPHVKALRAASKKAQEILNDHQGRRTGNG